MALAEDNPSTQSEKTESTHRPDNNKREKPLTKVIVRRLPPSMTQADFLTQVSPCPDYDYIYTVKGDMSLGENAFARVYLNFCNAEDVYIFKEKFDNYVFVDGKGHEYPAVVEYSSFQKVPKRRKVRPDPKVGTIETDPVYLEFLEMLKEQPEQEEKPEYSYQPSTIDKNDVTTPLLDYLKQRKMDRLRIREEKREERRKKEIERKKLRDDDRRRRTEDKVPPKKASVLKDKDDSKREPPEVKKEEKAPATEEKPEKPAGYSQKKERKYEDKKPVGKPQKYPKYDEKKDYKYNRDFHRNKYEEKKEYPKKVKKYSERREERKIEATKAEAKKDDVKEVAKVESKSEEVKEVKIDQEDKCEKSEGNSEDTDGRNRNKENDPRMQRRIRNKDRPAMVLYKPGMLRKKSVDNDRDSKDGDRDSKEKEVEKTCAE